MSTEVEIVLVEDNLNDAEMITRVLKKNCLTNKIIHLKDGAEAIDFIFAEGEYSSRNIADTPRVIFLDLKMPRISGIEVLKKIKSDERTKQIPIVVLTSSKEDPDIKTCFELGANSYVVKPVQFEKFVSAVAELGMYWTVLNQPPK
ncbi:MAG: response regulator [Bacteroidota bacterium]